MAVHRLCLPLLVVAAVSGCHSFGPLVKRDQESACPTDIRKTVPWCAGEDAIFHCPCGPSEEFYGHKPTCWRTWPAPGTVWRDSYCGTQPCGAGGAIPMEMETIRILPPTDEEPVPAAESVTPDTLEVLPPTSSLPPAHEPNPWADERVPASDDVAAAIPSVRARTVTHLAPPALPPRPQRDAAQAQLSPRRVLPPAPTFLAPRSVASAAPVTLAPRVITGVGPLDPLPPRFVAAGAARDALPMRDDLPVVAAHHQAPAGAVHRAQYEGRGGEETLASAAVSDEEVTTETGEADGSTLKVAGSAGRRPAATSRPTATTAEFIEGDETGGAASAGELLR